MLASLAVALFFMTATAVAGKRFALVIGNSSYTSAGVLPNARNDADLIAASLQAVGFETELLKDLGEEAFGAAIDRLEKRAASLDVVAFYFAGHGIQKGGQNFLIPIDARLESEAAIERQTIALQTVMDILERVPISLLFLDACRNNPFAEQLAASARSQGRSALVSRGLAVVRPMGDMLVTFATLPNSVASDGTGSNSPFARSLARHMKTPDTEVSVLMKRVTSDVMQETEGDQRPQQLSQMQREFYFIRSGTTGEVRDEIRSVLSVYPASVGTGEEIALVADVPTTCQPSFFDLSSGGKVTPIPQQFFKQVVLGNGQIRFEISPGSRYGLVVQDADERGAHRLGFFCEPAGLDRDGKVALLRKLVERFEAGELQGKVDLPGVSAAYHFQQYQIR